MVYCLFLLSNSAAAASLNGARAAEVEHDHQGLLNMALLTLGMIGFTIGVVLGATLIGQLGFGVVLAVIGVGHGRDGRFRRPLAAAVAPSGDGADLDLLIRGATVYPGDAPPFEGDVGVRGGEIVLVTNCHKDDAVLRRRARPSTAAG